MSHMLVGSGCRRHPLKTCQPGRVDNFLRHNLVNILQNTAKNTSAQEVKGWGEAGGHLLRGTFSLVTATVLVPPTQKWRPNPAEPLQNSLEQASMLGESGDSVVKPEGHGTHTDSRAGPPAEYVPAVHAGHPCPADPGRHTGPAQGECIRGQY